MRVCMCVVVCDVITMNLYSEKPHFIHSSIQHIVHEHLLMTDTGPSTENAEVNGAESLLLRSLQSI